MPRTTISQFSGPTRQRVLFLLKTDGQHSAETLGTALEISPVAVRQHLSSLEAEGLVVADIERRSVGRPIHMYRLSAEGDESFPRTYHHLAVSLLDELQNSGGMEAVKSLFASRRRRTVQTHSIRFQAKNSAQKTEELRSFTEANGYMPELNTDGNGGHYLTLHNCSICMVAKAHPTACAQELEMFRDLIGSDTKVERTQHRFSGDRNCVFHIQPVEPKP